MNRLQNPESSSTAAWAFVLQNAAKIRGLAKRTWTDSRVSMDDFHHELILDIALKFHTYDPNRTPDGNGYTWMYWRARKVKDRLLRSMSARKDQSHSTVNMDYGFDSDVPLSAESGKYWLPIEAGKYGSAEAMVAEITVNQVLRMASPLQADACRSSMEGWTGEEVKVSFGCSVQARNDRLHRLGQKMERPHAH